MTTPRGVSIGTLVEEALAHGSLFKTRRKSVAVVTTDGSVKRVPTIRVQSAIFTRLHGWEIAHKSDRWMTEKIDSALVALGRRREAGPEVGEPRNHAEEDRADQQ